MIFGKTNNSGFALLADQTESVTYQVSLVSSQEGIPPATIPTAPPLAPLMAPPATAIRAPVARMPLSSKETRTLPSRGGPALGWRSDEKIGSNTVYYTVCKYVYIVMCQPLKNWLVQEVAGVGVFSDSWLNLRLVSPFLPVAATQSLGAIPWEDIPLHNDFVLHWEIILLASTANVCKWSYTSSKPSSEKLLHLS